MLKNNENKAGVFTLTFTFYYRLCVSQDNCLEYSETSKDTKTIEGGAQATFEGKCPYFWCSLCQPSYSISAPMTTDQRTVQKHRYVYKSFIQILVEAIW